MSEQYNTAYRRLDLELRRVDDALADGADGDLELDCEVVSGGEARRGTSGRT